MWDCSTILRFNAEGQTDSCISESGNIVIEADCIDRNMKKPATFIKMDIEGAEYRALLGAREQIAKYSPRLAICLYHKPEDIWEIPSLICKLNHNYRFYLRNYTYRDTELVLYAV